MYSCKLKFILMVLIFSQQVFADSAAKNCNPQNYNDLVRCAIEQSSEISISNQQLKAAAGLEDATTQWANPDLDVESVQKGSEKSETSASIVFSLDLNGKRSARAAEARAEYKKAQTVNTVSVSQTKLDLILRLYRLSHIKTEIKIEQEAVETFNKIVGQFQKKPALSPEQEVSLSIFRMAMSDHELNLAALASEDEKLIQELVTSTGLSKELFNKNLPAKKSTWPQLASQNKEAQSPQMLIAQSELESAKSFKEKTDAEVWSDVKIGPVIKQVKDSSSSENYVGVALSVPLPLFNLNGAGKKYSQQKLVEAEMNYSLTSKKIPALRAQLAKKYENIVSSLKKTISTKSLEDKHNQMERLFFKGLVSSPLVIEAHRQLIELEQKRNAFELSAIETLGLLQIIDNNFTEVSL
ncbi:MAG: TolC family protein [Pseudobdellovibrio sp.]